MFGIFGNKKAKLEKKYAQLLQESHALSHTDRKASDLKMAEAAAIFEQIQAIEQQEAASAS